VSDTLEQPEARGGRDRLQIRSVPRADGAELQLAGELTLATLNAFREKLREIEAEAPDVLVVDLRQLRFVDSLALGELVATDRRSRAARRRLMLVTAAGPVERVLAVTGLDGRLQIRHEPPGPGEP
jgi:anti-sigma B factor antagonist